MQLVAVHGWQKDEAAVAKTIADALGGLVFEARQKIAGGGPAVLASFADMSRAEALAERLRAEGIPALVIDTDTVRKRTPFYVRRFVPGDTALRVESLAADASVIDYADIELLLVAICSPGQSQTVSTVTERKFSLGKTLMSGGIPMTKKVTHEETVSSENRDETLWLYAKGRGPVIFNRSALTYDGFGASQQMTSGHNFTLLKSELQRLAPQARFDDRLLRRPTLVRLLGPTLAPEVDLDLAFEVLARSLHM